MGLSKEQLLRSAQYAAFLFGSASFLFMAKETTEAGRMQEELLQQKAPLVEKYRREWAAQQSPDALFNFAVFSETNQYVRDAFVTKSINAESTVLIDLQHQINREGSSALLGAFGTLGGIFTGISIKTRRERKTFEEKQARRNQAYLLSK